MLTFGIRREKSMQPLLLKNTLEEEGYDYIMQLNSALTPATMHTAPPPYRNNKAAAQATSPFSYVSVENSKTINIEMAFPSRVKRGTQCGQRTFPIQAWKYPLRQILIGEQNENGQPAEIIWIYTFSPPQTTLTCKILC